MYRDDVLVTGLLEAGVLTQFLLLLEIKPVKLQKEHAAVTVRWCQNRILAAAIFVVYKRQVRYFKAWPCEFYVLPILWIPTNSFLLWVVCVAPVLLIVGQQKDISSLGQTCWSSIVLQNVHIL